MAIATNDEGDSALQSCDLCFSRHKRCDRKIPTCGLCQRLGHNCEYKRNPKFYYNKKPPPTYALMTSTFDLQKSKPLTNSNLTENDSYTNNKPKKLRKPQKLLRAKLPNLDQTIAGLLEVRKSAIPVQRLITSSFNSKSIVNVVGCLINFSLHCTDAKFALGFLQMAINQNLFDARAPSPLALTPGTSPITNLDLLTQAENAYFLYVNPCLPLFVKSTFDSSKRSRLLMVAIWVRGLQFLPPSSETKSLIDQLVPILIRSLNRKVVRNPTLSYLQVLVITYLSTRWLGPDTPRVTVLLELATNLAYLLGLHLPATSCGLPQFVLLERSLAYTSLVFLNNMLAMSTNSEQAIPSSHISSDPLPCHQIAAFSNLPFLPFSDKLNLELAHLVFQMSQGIFQIQILRYHAPRNEVSKKQTKEWGIRFLNTIKDEYESALARMDKLKRNHIALNIDSFEADYIIQLDELFSFYSLFYHLLILSGLSAVAFSCPNEEDQEQVGKAARGVIENASKCGVRATLATSIYAVAFATSHLARILKEKRPGLPPSELMKDVGALKTSRQFFTDFSQRPSSFNRHPVVALYLGVIGHCTQALAPQSSA